MRYRNSQLRETPLSPETQTRNNDLQEAVYRNTTLAKSSATETLPHTKGRKSHSMISQYKHRRTYWAMREVIMESLRRYSSKSHPCEPRHPMQKDQEWCCFSPFRAEQREWIWGYQSKILKVTFIFFTKTRGAAALSANVTPSPTRKRLTAYWRKFPSLFWRYHRILFFKKRYPTDIIYWE